MGAFEYWLAPHSFVFNSANYEIIKQNSTWTEAASIAVSRGGKLAEINTADEQNAIFAELGNASITPADTVAPDGGGGAYVWIGGNDIAVEGNWVWDGDNDSVVTPVFGAGIIRVLKWPASSITGEVYSRYKNEPDDYLAQQDALALSLNGWPLGVASQWNDINQK